MILDTPIDWRAEKIRSEKLSLRPHVTDVLDRWCVLIGLLFVSEVTFNNTHFQLE